MSKNENRTCTEVSLRKFEDSTPDKISKLIFELSQLYQPKNVLNICCGTGNLLSYFNYLDLLKGIDINASYIEEAKKINSKPKFIQENFLEYNFESEKYDCIVGHLPFGMKIHNKKYAEIELIKKSLSLINDGGAAIFIVMESILFGKDKDLNIFRDHLLSKFSLDIIVSLPLKSFEPYTGIKTSIIVIRNGESKDHIFMPEFKNNTEEIITNLKEKKGDFYIKNSKINSNRLDRNYYYYIKKINNYIKGMDVINLSEISTMIKGLYLNKKKVGDTGEYRIFNGNTNHIDINLKNTNVILIDLDIIIGNGSVFIYKDDGIKTIINNNYRIIRATDKNKYISLLFQQEILFKLFKYYTTLYDTSLIGNRKIYSLNSDIFLNFKIPILPIIELDDMIVKTTEVSNPDDMYLLINKFFTLKSSKHLNHRNYNMARNYINKAFYIDSAVAVQHKNIYLDNINKTEQLEREVKEKEAVNQSLQLKDKELNNLIAMFAHNFLGTLQCIRSNAEHENNPELHLKTVKMMGGALTAFSVISSDDDKLVEQLKQDNTGETTLSKSLVNNLALAISQLLSKTNKDKIINLYLNYLLKTGEIDTETNAEALRFNKVYRKKWQTLQRQWEDEFNALFSEEVELEALKAWVNEHLFNIEIIGFDQYDFQFKEYAMTDSMFLVIFMEIFVNALKYIDVKANKPLILTLSKENERYLLSCENPSKQESYRGTHKGMDFLQTIAKKLNGELITESTETNFKTTFVIPAELLD